jgi:MSHA biogenesis protein MshE
MSARASDPRKLRIGDLLVSKKLITEAQLEEALREQKRLGLKLGHALIELGFVEEDALLEAVAGQLGIPFIDLDRTRPDGDVVRLLPETHARRFRAIVLEERDGALLVGMADPSDVNAYDHLTRLLRRRLQLAVVRESALLALVDRVYRQTEEITRVAEELQEELGETAHDLDRMAEETAGAETPVVRLLQSIFLEAVRSQASDIHIEPEENLLRVRQRIDGALHEHVLQEVRIASALVVRLKLMASLDISERRLPQDGRFNVKVENRSIDVRLSTMPVQHGESVVMRLLDQSQGTPQLDALGMPERMVLRLRELIHRPHGLIVVTGPTGSGKTTTLYASLAELNRPERKLITVEDPVEYRLPRVNQVQVKTKIGLTFASVLRAALRQDPDVVMVGEMRDQETAEIALRAAMTGHLVLSTLHTNDAVSTAARLADMGAPGYLIASALRAVLAQRLVRLLCPDCATPAPLEEPERAWLQSLGKRIEDATFMRGRGCTRCRDTGHRGRIGVYEMLEMDAAMADALRSGDTAEYTRAAHASRRFRLLVSSVVDLASKGRTTLDEALRVAGEVEVPG